MSGTGRADAGQGQDDGPGQSVGGPGGTLDGRVRRTMPRRSRSSRMTRAAASRSGSRRIVEAIQSTYDGSNAAISPRVWPWNFPNGISVAVAAARLGWRGGLKRWTRERTSGPFGSEARRGPISAALERIGAWPGGWPARPGRVVVALRGWRTSVVSRRAVTGLVGLGAGGPDGRRSAVDPAAVLPGRARSVSCSYAALISAIRFVAARVAAVSLPDRSGWCSRARRRQAALIALAGAPGFSPRTAWGSRLVIGASLAVPA